MNLIDKNNPDRIYKIKISLGLFAAGIITSFLSTLFTTVPGYMDAEYYFAGGLQLFGGHGFNEPFLWNYLDHPSGIPHPSHIYWMPLPSILSALGMFVLGDSTFFAGRIPFILLSGFVPPLVGLTAYRLTQRKTDMLLAGGLAVFSGFYTIYLSLSESFALYMLFGCLIMLFGFSNPLKNGSKRAQIGLWLTLGVFAGCMHLSRADGVLWFFAVIGLLFWQRWIKERGHAEKWFASLLLAIVFGYVFIMGAWYGRNVVEFGTIMAPGNSRTLWLTDYNQTFVYPPENLNLQHWLSYGWKNHIQVRWDAVWMNLKTALAVQGVIFLFPFMVMGAWKLRKNPMVVFGLTMWVITLGFMSIVFPFAGSRGGFFHSGAALQPMLWALIPTGFDTAISYGVRWRRWDRVSAKRFFAIGLIGLSMLFTVGLYYSRVIGSEPESPVWASSSEKYAQLGEYLAQQGAQKTAPVMVNNPPGFWLATGYPAIVIPDGDEQTLFVVAKRYGAQYVILEMDHVRGLDSLYEKPFDRDGLQLMGEIGDTLIFQIEGG